MIEALIFLLEDSQMSDLFGGEEALGPAAHQETEGRGVDPGIE
jgi:hypothetical protein